MIHALRALLIALTIASPASAQKAGTLDDAEHVFARWVRQRGITRASLAVARGDRLVLAKGYGTSGSRSRP